MQSYFRNTIITENSCATDVYNYSLDACPTIINTNLSFGYGNYSSRLATNHKYSAPGKYIATFNDESIPFYKEATVHSLLEVNSNKNLIQC